MAYELEPVLTVGKDGEIFIRSKTGSKMSDEKWVEVAKLLGLSDDQRSNLDLFVQVLKETRGSAENEIKVETITDEQWTELQRLSRLPDESRGNVEYAISLLRAFSVAEEVNAFRRRTDAMRSAADSAKRLARLTLEIGRSNVLNYPPDREGLLSVQLNGYANYLESRLQELKPGPKHDGKAFVVRMLNFTLIDYTGRGLHRGNREPDGYSPADFIDRIFDMAGCERSTAETLVKEQVDVVRSWEPEYRPGDIRPRGTPDKLGRNYWFFGS